MSLKPKKILIITLLLAMLVMVRVLENWFYDPLIPYFEFDYLQHPIPEINTPKLIFNLILRYVINSGISLLLIWNIFKDRSLMRFSLWFYLIVLLFFLPQFVYLLYTKFENFYLPAFYLRRFLIQPLFVFILIPAFHYQIKVSKTKN